MLLLNLFSKTQITKSKSNSLVITFSRLSFVSIDMSPNINKYIIKELQKFKDNENSQPDIETESSTQCGKVAFVGVFGLLDDSLDVQ